MKGKQEVLDFYGFQKKKASEATTIRYNSLYQCYDRPSQAKQNAFEYCLELVRALGGENYGIIGYNCNAFSFGFTFTNDYGVECFAYITKDYNRYWEVK